MISQKLKISRLKTKFWFAYAAVIFGDGYLPRPPIWFAREFPRPGISPEDDVSNWKKYKWGKAVPRTRDGYNPVIAVSGRPPHRDFHFNSPFWNVLSGDKLSKEKINEAIADLGIKISVPKPNLGEIPEDAVRSRDERFYETSEFGDTGRIILDESFWNENADPEVIQDYRMTWLLKYEDFDLLEVIVLMLAWAHRFGNIKLWNELCDYYFNEIPKIILTSDMDFKYEMMDAVDEYAKKRTLIPFRPDIEEKRSWRDHIPSLQENFTKHLEEKFQLTGMIFNYEFPKPFLHWWASLVSEAIMEDEKIWQHVNILWEPAAILFYILAQNGVVEFNSEAAIDDKYFTPKETKHLKNSIKETMQHYIERPEIFDDYYEIILTG